MAKNGNHKQAFKNALAGLWLSFKTERNLRLMGIISVLVLLLSFFLKVSLIEFTIIVWAIFAVLAVEMINTSLEAITDLVREEWHHQAKLAKDVAAGMVLLAVLGSVVVGSLIFIPKILNLVFSISA
ncbi:MAG: diacylglycerol kinase family protein [Candidatus Pacebacteria bacterium]|nr:diacylglycerol kinase family protein [Candidatus Paceibacterota bacterium]